tara:strand:+ start:882 stop:1415 length:534 start_codon:yes stop_codon:yes gene_type:complete
MRIFLFLLISILLSNCATIEIAKEVSKASESIQASVKKITKKDDKEEEIAKNNNLEKNQNQTLEEKVVEIKKEKASIKIEKEEEEKIVKKQKQLVEINFIGQTVNEVYEKLGESNLLRFDGNTQTMRYDTNSCRLFLFFNSSISLPSVKHFEFRDSKGRLINSKAKINECYINFKLA